MLQALPQVDDICLSTHFSDADGPRGVDWQLETFERAVAGLALPRSLANSAATLSIPEAHADWVRPGIALYGATPYADDDPLHRAEAFGLKPVQVMQTRVIGIQHVAKGEAVGYGGRFRAQRDTRIGVVAIGYADGYPRAAADPNAAGHP